MSIDAHESKPKRAAYRSPVGIVIGIVGVCLLTIGALGIRDYLLAINEGESIPSGEIVTAANDQPSEKRPAIDQPYIVPADQPRSVEIPSLGITSFVQRLGVDQSGSMATPNNIYFTGWYVESVVPGEKGVSILNGHVGGRYSPGIFKDLKNIEEGKSIRVEMGDLSWREFRVVSTTSYALSEAAEPLFHNDPSIDQELHLITCDGVYNKATETYDQRIIVVAERIL